VKSFPCAPTRAQDSPLSDRHLGAGRSGRERYVRKAVLIDKIVAERGHLPLPAESGRAGIQTRAYRTMRGCRVARAAGALFAARYVKPLAVSHRSGRARLEAQPQLRLRLGASVRRDNRP
jgi:hypothetical protein